MKTIEERARDYQRSDEDDGTTATAFQNGAEWMRKELTRWRDPKEELPEYVKAVEVKYKAFGKIMMAVAWRLGCLDNGEDVWYIDGTSRRIYHENIIGWREIQE